MKASCEHEEDGSVDNDINGVSSGEQITTNESKRSNFDKLKRRYSFSEKFKFGKSSSSFNLTDTKQSPLIRCGSSSFPNILLVGPYDILNDSKSESDVTLEETSWKTAESSEKESSDSRSCKSVISVESTRYTLSVDKFSTPIFVERTESVEDMQKMPAYGDLILDASSTTVTKLLCN
uniref:Uncharacterized protein n=1 Tax=Photinus pyralis TaxID=7054 RepID=A0A1Y1MAG1_PHOPY